MRHFAWLVPSLSLSRRRGLLTVGSLVLLGSALAPDRLHAQDTLRVDLAAPIGMAGDPLATGFRGPWWDEVPDSLIVPLKPSLVGAPTGVDREETDTQGTTWTRAASLGAFVDLVLFDGFGVHHTDLWADTTDCAGLSDAECYDHKMALWNTLLHRWLVYADSARVVGATTVPVHFDVWNEPDPPRGDWSPDPRFGASDSLFFQVWQTAAESVWAHGGLLMGPSFAGGVVGVTDTTGSGVTLDGLLGFWADSGTWPDIFAWHHIANSDYRTDGAGDSTRLNLLEQVRYAKARLAAAGADTAREPHSSPINALPSASLGGVP